MSLLSQELWFRIQPGYMFGDRLLRPLVGISKKNEADNKEKDIKK